MREGGREGGREKKYKKITTVLMSQMEHPKTSDPKTNSREMGICRSFGRPNNRLGQDLDPTLPTCDGNLCFGGHCSWHDASGRPRVRPDRFPDMLLGIAFWTGCCRACRVYTCRQLTFKSSQSSPKSLHKCVQERRVVSWCMFVLHTFLKGLHCINRINTAGWHNR